MNEETAWVLEGPWDQAYAFQVDMEIRSKSNHRRYSKGKSAGRDDWKSLVSFETNLGLLARSARPAGWDLGDADKDLPQRPMVVSFVYARSVLDAANLSKSVLDACQRVVFHNDASVRYCATLGLRTKADPGGLVAFARLPHDASTEDVMNASLRLQEQCLPLL